MKIKSAHACVKKNNRNQNVLFEWHELNETRRRYELIESRFVLVMCFGVTVGSVKSTLSNSHCMTYEALLQGTLLQR
jgi:hypothetical protein